MRRLAFLSAMLAVAACTPQVPNSAAGVGFGDYASYAARREAELRGQPQPAPGQPVVPPAPAASGAPLSALAPAPVAAPAAAPATPEAALGAEAMAALGLAAPAPAPVSAPVAAQASPAQISAAKSGAAGPNLAAYALAATQAPGSAVYPRGGIHLVSSDKACARFVSPDLAQIAFLEAGGPEKDRKNLDPDGDGFACGWDPRPFRAGLQ